MVKTKAVMASVIGFLRKHKIAVIVAVTVVAVISASVGILVAVASPDDGVIAKGVRVNGIDIGGMTVEEAKIAIENSDYFNGSFRLVCGDEIVNVDGSDIGLKIDSEKSIASAYEIARNAGFTKKFGQSVKLLTGGVDITAYPMVDTVALDSILYDMGVRINGEAQDAVIEAISETEIRIYPPIAGQGKNVEQLRVTVLNALHDNGMGIDIALQFPQDNSVKLNAEEVKALIKTDPVDASYAVNDKKLTITNEIMGRDVDIALIEEKLEAFNNGSPIELTVTYTVPAVTADSLNGNLFGTELSQYSSNFASSSANRAFNVSRAAASVNGTILLPGDVFSYNSAIGNPNFENGYKLASVYANGKQTEGVGGGVCQVSSTIYSAVLYANLEIVERRSHSLTVNYVPLGQDATVSYGSVDFKFKNNTDAPIKLEVSTNGGICKVRVLGAKPKVEQKVEIINTCVSTSSPVDNITYDNSLAEGTRKVISSGKTGYVYDSVRKVSENGVVVKTENLTRSNYRMVPTDVIVGTKAAEAPQPTTPTPPQTTPAPQPVTPTPDSITPPTPPATPAPDTTVPPAEPTTPAKENNPPAESAPSEEKAPEQTPSKEPEAVPVSPADEEETLV